MHKIEEEKKNINFMISLYCKGNHKNHWKNNNKELCQECRELRDFAYMRIEKCPMKDTKTFCSTCTIQCYPKEKRQAIREVMKWAGPRMLLYNPPLAFKHVYNTIKNKKKKEV